VPKGLQEKLFKEMFATKGTSGTGLGLLVTHKIVKEHGGRTLFRGSPCGGAIFEIALPQKGPYGHQAYPTGKGGRHGN
jgi:signal transduction histidine kinase